MEEFYAKFTSSKLADDFQKEVLSDVEQSVVHHLPGMWELLSDVEDGKIEEPPAEYWSFMSGMVEECSSLCEWCKLERVYNKRFCLACEEAALSLEEEEEEL